MPLKNVHVWKEAQARRLDRSRVRDIAKSIRSEGLQNPPVIQRGGRGLYLLISGHHRLAALKYLGAKKSKFLVITKDTEYGLDDAKAASVVENLHRLQMSPRELADACKFLAEQTTKSEAAKKLGMSMPTFKKYHGFAGVPDKIKAMVPGTISRDEATRLYQAVPTISQALKVVSKIAKLDRPSRRIYLRLLAQSPRSGHKIILKRMRKVGIKKKIPIELGKNGARKLSRLAEREGTDETRLANRIVREYLRKRR
ncbi:transcriptional regulator [Cenarchaeum symbiosum A]|uniref:Transcriptional regulator n=1 Tax=Cenarchaeum symbiosum (strain A) TaxID=414004 RepID=A0RWT3_CENSY|nr:transcriptional regulator [Cenarchaeum symbiosum A]